MVDIVVGRNSKPSSPDLIGDRSSLIKLVFNKLQPKSDIVLKIKEKNWGTILKTLVWSLSSPKRRREANVRGREGLSALYRQEISKPIRV